jgi:hypothetical protein
MRDAVAKHDVESMVFAGVWRGWHPDVEHLLYVANPVGVFGKMGGITLKKKSVTRHSENNMSHSSTSSPTRKRWLGLPRTVSPREKVAGAWMVSRLHLVPKFCVYFFPRKMRCWMEGGAGEGLETSSVEFSATASSATVPPTSPSAHRASASSVGRARGGQS